MAKQIKVASEGLNFYYGEFKALDNITLEFEEHQVAALIGPSGCGKSTFLRCINRMNDLIPGTRVEGRLTLGSEDIYAPGLDVVALRRRIGMVFQKPNPFPKTIYENVAYGLRVNGVKNKRTLDESVESSLRGAALWDEVKDKLKNNAQGLSGGQQQRLCIARTIALKPQVLLLDEPTSALDPISTGRIEQLITELKQEFTVVIVTHNMQQAARCSDYTAFMFLGDLIEFGDTDTLFTKPAKEQTEDYITGRFG